MVPLVGGVVRESTSDGQAIEDFGLGKATTLLVNTK